jgi:ribosome-interacting GTPase 1
MRRWRARSATRPLSELHPAQSRTRSDRRYHLGQLKAKLAKLRRELITPSGGGGGGPGIGFDVARTGQATIGFVGESGPVRLLAIANPRLP